MQSGSFISTGDEASVFARFSFRRHFFQHAGFRVVRSLHPTPVRLVDLTLDLKFDLTQIPNLERKCLVPTTNCQYNSESPDLLRDSLLANYSNSPSLSNVQAEYLAAIHAIAKSHVPSSDNILVCGSATGALPFELSKTYHSIIGSDFCAQFANSAIALQAGLCPLMHCLEF